MEPRLLLVDVVGLTPSLIGPDTPHLAMLRDGGGAVMPLECPFPALTCSSQATLLTGRLPREHGIVGNGWFFRELQEIWLWRQSFGLVQAEDVHARILRERPGSTVARMFLWYAMGAPSTWCVTPRPQYKADGRKLPDIWTQPSELRAELQSSLGQFPLFQFWGPGAGLPSSRWIVEAARHVWDQKAPSVLSVYVPHLDYDLQRYGPDDPRSREALRAVDGQVGPLIEDCLCDGATAIVFSEYGIDPVSRPVHPNRALREAGLLIVRDEDGELLDPVASRAFAVADHQIAHVYVRDSRDLSRTRDVLERLPGVAEVLDEDGKRREGLDHARSGEFVLVSEPDAWFTYYYWLDDRRAPDFARCVDIHRKPGYDPAELFFDPTLTAPKLRAAMKLARKLCGFRTVFDLVGLDASIIRGSHGRRAARPELGPVLLVSDPALLRGCTGTFPAAAFPDLVMRSLG